MFSLSKNINSIFLTSIFFLTPVYPFSVVSGQIADTSTSNTRQQLLIKDELYFGLTKSGGGTISEEEWQQFLNTAITPRFQDGLTVLDAYGQYLNSAGVLAKEKSKLVILIYENRPERNQAIAEIIDLYKRTFQQESVLRVTSEVKASF